MYCFSDKLCKFYFDVKNLSIDRIDYYNIITKKLNEVYMDVFTIFLSFIITSIQLRIHFLFILKTRYAYFTQRFLNCADILNFIFKFTK